MFFVLLAWILVRRRALHAGAAAMALGMITVLALGAPAAQADGDAFRDREDQLAVQLGRARVEAGLLPLARSQALDRAALAHAQDMVAGGYMEHEAPDGSTPGSRAAQAGYDTGSGGAWLVVETLSAISDAPDGALAWWLSDGLHRRVVLRPTWREVGVGYAAGGPYGRFWVALFGCRPNVLPPVLLDGMLATPDEACGRGGSAFGPVESERVGETSAAAQQADWQPYQSRRAWASGHPAVVQMRDTAGHELEASAADPTGAATEAR
jgi:Cysteine-rich secretory protein family